MKKAGFAPKQLAAIYSHWLAVLPRVVLLLEAHVGDVDSVFVEYDEIWVRNPFPIVRVFRERNRIVFSDEGQKHSNSLKFDQGEFHEMCFDLKPAQSEQEAERFWSDLDYACLQICRHANEKYAEFRAASKATEMLDEIAKK